MSRGRPIWPPPFPWSSPPAARPAAATLASALALFDHRPGGARTPRDQRVEVRLLEHMNVAGVTLDEILALCRAVEAAAPPSPSLDVVARLVALRDAVSGALPARRAVGHRPRAVAPAAALFEHLIRTSGFSVQGLADRLRLASVDPLCSVTISLQPPTAHLVSRVVHELGISPMDLEIRISLIGGRYDALCAAHPDFDPSDISHPPIGREVLMGRAVDEVLFLFPLPVFDRGAAAAIESAFDGEHES